MEDIKSFGPLWGCWYIKEPLGEGGYGKVYRIERNEYGVKYEAALKHIRIPRSKAEIKSIMLDGMDERSITTYFEGFIEEIIKEFALMSKLKGNSHIVSYEDHIIEKSNDELRWDIFIRMELLTSFIDYVTNRKITNRDIIKLGIDICKALETCQKYNIIHRDIKPENIFVSNDGQFKLGDFGIARQVEKTASGLSKKGTYTYIAPEVYKGEAYGSSVDTYSLGLVMYRFLNNNRMPFMPPYPNPISHTDKENSFAMRISGRDIPKPINGEGRLSEIVLKACAYNPKDRYGSPGEMRRELEAIFYSQSESNVIYPKGDNIDIKSVEYVNSDNSKQQPYGFENATMPLQGVNNTQNIPTKTISNFNNQNTPQQQLYNNQPNINTQQPYNRQPYGNTPKQPVHNGQPYGNAPKQPVYNGQTYGNAIKKQNNTKKNHFLTNLGVVLLGIFCLISLAQMNQGYEEMKLYSGDVINRGPISIIVIAHFAVFIYDAVTILKFKKGGKIGVICSSYYLAMTAISALAVGILPIYVTEASLGVSNSFLFGLYFAAYSYLLGTIYGLIFLIPSLICCFLGMSKEKNMNN